MWSRRDSCGDLYISSRVEQSLAFSYLIIIMSYGFFRSWCSVSVLSIFQLYKRLVTEPPCSHHVLATMLIKVKTLTGKEIEIDIEPTDKVERIKVRRTYNGD